MKTLVSKPSNLLSLVSGQLVNVCLTQQWIDKLISKYNQGYDKHLLMYNVKQQTQNKNCYVLSIEFRCFRDMFNELYQDLLIATAKSKFEQDKEFPHALKY